MKRNNAAHSMERRPLQTVRRRHLRVLLAAAVVSVAGLLAGCVLATNTASFFFSTPSVWTHGAVRLGEDGSEVPYTVMSMRLESDHRATVFGFPQGRSVQREYKGKASWCVELSDAGEYAGAATWKRINDFWIEVSFPGSEIRIASGVRRFQAAPDWTQVSFRSCSRRPGESWAMHLDCGPSLLPKAEDGKPTTCQAAHTPRPTSMLVPNETAAPGLSLGGPRRTAKSQANAGTQWTIDWSRAYFAPCTATNGTTLYRLHMSCGVPPGGSSRGECPPLAHPVAVTPDRGRSA